MTARTCRRLWEVEAARDGRLSGKALAAFEEHAAVCRDCGGERRALDSLQRKFVDDAAPADEVTLRRERERLLAQVDSVLRNPSSGGRRAAVTGVAMACGVAALIGWATLRTEQGPASPSPIASIVASPGARWERHSTPGLEQVALNDGVLSLSIRRSASDPRVSVRVPDGDIDDVGTSFSVSVEGGRTREIAVRDGAIVFRQRGAPALLLTSPSVWVAPPPATGVPDASRRPGAATPVAIPPANAKTPLRVHERKHADVPTVSSSEAAPADEDLAYLNIVALRREGRVEEARVAAGGYLRKFPHGFRRDEVRAVVREHP